MPAWLAKRLVVLTVALVPFAASAGIITESLTVIMDGEGIYTGRTYTATLSYDDTNLTGSDVRSDDDSAVTGGDVILFGTRDSVELDLGFEGMTYDETDDADFPDYPRLSFVGDLLVFINFLITDGINGVSFDDPFIAELEINGTPTRNAAGGLDVAGFVFVDSPPPEPVPAPASFVLVLLALLGMATRFGSRPSR